MFGMPLTVGNVVWLVSHGLSSANSSPSDDSSSAASLTSCSLTNSGMSASSASVACDSSSDDKDSGISDGVGDSAGRASTAFSGSTDANSVRLSAIASAGAVVSGGVTVGDGVTVGGGVTVDGGATVGGGVTVGGVTVADGDVGVVFGGVSIAVTASATAAPDGRTVLENSAYTSSNCVDSAKSSKDESNMSDGNVSFMSIDNDPTGG